MKWLERHADCALVDFRLSFGDRINPPAQAQPFGIAVRVYLWGEPKNEMPEMPPETTEKFGDLYD